MLGVVRSDCSETQGRKIFRGWLGPELDRASMDDGPENVAGGQDTDRVTRVVDDGNCAHMFTEHDTGNLLDLCGGGGG